MKNRITLFLLALVFIFLIACKSNLDQKPFIFNGNTLKSLIENSIKGDENSSNILSGLISFKAPLNSFNKISIDSIEIDNKYYYTLLLENQNSVYNLFAIIDKDLNLILKDESLNGYLNLNFKKSGSRIFVVLNEEFNSKDVVRLNRVSYYSLEQYSSGLVLRQFTKIESPGKEAEQVITSITDTAITTSIFNRGSKTNKSSKDIFKYDVSTNKYLSIENVFDSLIYREVRSISSKTKNYQITDGESIIRFIESNNLNAPSTNLKLNENDFSIELDSTWNKIKNVTISNFVRTKLEGIKFISSKLGAAISIAAISPIDSAENYFYEDLNNKVSYGSIIRYSDKLVDKKNIYQLYELSCPNKKILMIFETPKSSYEANKSIYEQIIKTFLVKC